jgi:hypothetical protein
MALFTDTTRYRIIRMFKNGGVSNRVIHRHLTLEEAQAHCRDRETSSSTAVKPHNVRRTKAHGPWFDGYEQE